MFTDFRSFEMPIIPVQVPALGVFPAVGFKAGRIQARTHPQIELFRPSVLKKLPRGQRPRRLIPVNPGADIHPQRLPGTRRAGRVSANNRRPGESRNVSVPSHAGPPRSRCCSTPRGCRSSHRGNRQCFFLNAPFGFTICDWRLTRFRGFIRQSYIANRISYICWALATPP